jgi:hypothetical protein
MRYLRLYADQNGDSAFEDVDLAQAPTQPSTQVGFRSFPPGWQGSRIIADGRLFVFIVTGEVVLTVSDGTERSVGPGRVVLVEDTWGQGHAARVVGDEASFQAFVQLAH